MKAAHLGTAGPDPVPGAQKPPRSALTHLEMRVEVTLSHNQRGQEPCCFPQESTGQQRPTEGEPGSGAQENVSSSCPTGEREEEGDRGLEMGMGGASCPGLPSARETASTPTFRKALTIVCQLPDSLTKSYG